MSDKAPVFDREAALNLLDGDEELLSILIDSFLTENKFEKSSLEKMISSGDMSEAASYVHATKGAARQLCMEKLKNSGQKLEDLLRGKTSGDAQSLVDEMWKDYGEGVARLKINP
ncbi:MAG: Hpt domain-containing protein [Treponema sp.]|uniref:Hpt domain-containing protein n=1 Tax=Treponema sp. TaxID=166 RepID=UPI0025E25766|nr:Hpt domain-containing protein [Treponema sp.]MBQ9280995.1 Hpt domain-containing protein [Treponema sp.]